MTHRFLAARAATRRTSMIVPMLKKGDEPRARPKGAQSKVFLSAAVLSSVAFRLKGDSNHTVQPLSLSVISIGDGQSLVPSHDVQRTLLTMSTTAAQKPVFLGRLKKGLECQHPSDSGYSILRGARCSSCVLSRQASAAGLSKTSPCQRRLFRSVRGIGGKDGARSRSRTGGGLRCAAPVQAHGDSRVSPTFSLKMVTLLHK